MNKTGITHIALICALLAPLVIFGQATVEIEKGDKAFDNLAYEEALYFFEVAHEQNSRDARITRRIGNVYRRLGQMAMSAEWYKKTLELDSTNALDMLYYAESLKSLSQYDEAIEWYNRYALKKPDDSRALSHLSDPEYYKDLFADTSRYMMKRLALNNPHPAISITRLDSDTYLLSAINAQQADQQEATSEYLQYLDVYQVSFSEGDELTLPVRLSNNVNSRYHDGPACFSPGDSTLYITRNNIRNGKPIVDKKGDVNLKIYSSTLSGTEWSPAQELHFNDDGFSNGHPALSADGQKMYMVSNRDGGLGGTDLYVSERNESGWSDPVNLGSTINTEGNEMFPFISEDGKLFFASDGHAGLGGLDVFTSSLENGVWQKPRNLGAPLNSIHDDFALYYEENTDRGFYCSNRSGRGNDDIFFYRHKTLDKTLLVGTIVARNHDVKLAGERIRIETTNTGLITEQRLDDQEAFQITADPGDRIEVYMTNPTYFDTSTPVFKSTIPDPILDPYVNLGKHYVDLKKIPPAGGLLAPEPSGLQPGSHSSLADTPVKSSGDTTPSKSSARKSNSALIITNSDGSADSESGRLYKESLAFAEQLYRQQKYDAAREYYNDALKYKPGDLFTLARLGDINERLTVQNAPVAKGGYSSMKPRQDFQTTPSIVDLASLQIDNVLFDYDKSGIRADQQIRLDKVLQILRDNPTTRILIKAHCDSRGSESYNERLSMNRAQSVRSYLVQKGLEKDRIQTEWFGESKPLNQCGDGNPCAEQDYEINRRAEFKIVAGGE